jgi:hypothetical protein
VDGDDFAVDTRRVHVLGVRAHLGIRPSRQPFSPVRLHRTAILYEPCVYLTLWPV